MTPIRYIDIPITYGVPRGEPSPPYYVPMSWDEVIVSVETVVPPFGGDSFFRVWLARRVSTP